MVGRMGRRKAMGMAGAAAAAFGSAAASPARALTLETAPAALAQSYLSACRDEEAFHTRLRRDVAAGLAAQGAPADPEVLDRLLAAVACPRCGCPLG